MMAHFLVWMLTAVINTGTGTLVPAQATKKKKTYFSPVLSKQLSESIQHTPSPLKKHFHGCLPEYEHPFSTNWQDAANITLKEVDWLVSSCLKAYNKQPEAVNWTRYG